MLADGDFRDDLYYRINIFPIEIPPLRERKGGRLILARTLLEKFAAQHKLNY